MSVSRSRIDLKATQLPALQFSLGTRDLQALGTQCEMAWGDSAGAFDGEALCIDCSALPEGEPLQLDALLALLRRWSLLPVAVRGAARLQADELAACRKAGLAVLDDNASLAPAPASPAAPAPAPLVQPGTLVIDRPLRSGQQIYARDADLVVLGLVSHGAEVIADGHIHVYGALRGRAIAGAKGRGDARILAQSLEAELLAIAGTFRTSEKPLPPEVFAQAAQVRLDGERLVIEPLKY